MLGKQHPSKPVTPSDKKMSEKHLKHRAKIEDMKAKGKDPEKILKKSIEYNQAHANEHLDALEKAKSKLASSKRDAVKKALSKIYG